VDTRAIFVQNTGRKAATDVQIIFNYKPTNFDIMPAKSFQEQPNPDGRFILTLDKMMRREFVSVRLSEVSPSEIRYVLRVSHSEGEGKILPMAPQQVLPRKILIAAALLMYLGLLRPPILLFALSGF
jgi:hypothetical protein